MAKIYTINGKHSDCNGHFTITGSDIGLCDNVHGHSLEEVPTVGVWFKTNKSKISHTHTALQSININNTPKTGIVEIEANSTIQATSNGITISTVQDSSKPIKAINDVNDSTPLLINTDDSILTDVDAINFGGIA